MSEKHTAGTVKIPAFELPMSDFLGSQSRDIVLKERLQWQNIMDNCPSSSLKEISDYWDKHYYHEASQAFKKRYAVSIEKRTIAGIPTEVFTPEAGIPIENTKKVLINFHGGGFYMGARYGGQLESIPIAALAKVTVVSVDYRQSPDYVYPAATEDALAVYQSLLTDYQPENIGIYGCSAGAYLSGQTLARLQKHGLPLPAAVAMLSGAPLPFFGDANYFIAALEGRDPSPSMKFFHYFKDVSTDDKDAFPGLDTDMVSHFPPSLLIGSTRDFFLGQIVNMHGRLVKQGVQAELHVWDGLYHTFMYSADLEESREVFDVVVKFFQRHMGK